MEKCVLFDAGEDVWKRFRQSKIALQSLAAEEKFASGQCEFRIVGKVRVANFAYKKVVFARLTFDDWASYRDYAAEYVESSQDGMSDVFTITLTQKITRPVHVEFALCCVQFGIQMWDNNEEKNYRFRLDEKIFPSLVLTMQAAIIESQMVAMLECSQVESQSTSGFSQFKAHPLTPTKGTAHTYTTTAVDEKVVVANSPAEHAVLGSEQSPGVVTEPVIVSVTADRPDPVDDDHEELFKRLSLEGNTQEKTTPGDTDSRPGVEGIEVSITETKPEEPIAALYLSDKKETDPNIQEVSEQPIDPVKCKRPEDDTSQDDALLKISAANEDRIGGNESTESPKVDGIYFEERRESGCGQGGDIGEEPDMNIELQIIEESDPDKGVRIEGGGDQAKENVSAEMEGAGEAKRKEVDGQIEQSDETGEADGQNVKLVGASSEEKVCEDGLDKAEGDLVQNAATEDSGKQKERSGEPQNGLERISEGGSKSDVSDPEKEDDAPKKRKGPAGRFFSWLTKPCGGGKKRTKS